MQYISFFMRTSNKALCPLKNFIKRTDLGGKSKEISMKYTRFEKARIIGARALQISMGAPILVSVPEDLLDPVQIAMMEYEKDRVPITVVRDY